MRDALQGWKNSSVQLSERLRSLGIMRTQLRVPLKRLSQHHLSQHQWDPNCSPIMLKDGSFSDNGQYFLQIRILFLKTSRFHVIGFKWSFLSSLILNSNISAYEIFCQMKIFACYFRIYFLFAERGQIIFKCKEGIQIICSGEHFSYGICMY